MVDRVEKRYFGLPKKEASGGRLRQGAGVRGRTGRLHLRRPWAAALWPAGSAMERQKRAESGAEWRWRVRGVSSNYLPSSGVLRRGPPLGRLRSGRTAFESASHHERLDTEHRRLLGTAAQRQETNRSLPQRLPARRATSRRGWVLHPIHLRRLHRPQRAR